MPIMVPHPNHAKFRRPEPSSATPHVLSPSRCCTALLADGSLPRGVEILAPWTSDARAASFAPPCLASVCEADACCWKVCSPRLDDPRFLPQSVGAQEKFSDVAFVETLTGQAVALVSGRPTLLGPSEVITNRTRVDVLANSELRVCHYQTARFLTVKGPARIIVSVDGINVEAGKAVVSSETCGLVEASAHQGGLVARGYRK